MSDNYPSEKPRSIDDFSVSPIVDALQIIDRRIEQRIASNLSEELDGALESVLGKYDPSLSQINKTLMNMIEQVDRTTLGNRMKQDARGRIISYLVKIGMGSKE